MKKLTLKTGGMRYNELVHQGREQFERELFLWVFASSAVFGVDPELTLVNKCTDANKRAEVLLSWSKKGYVCGTPAHWQFNPTFLKSVSENLRIETSFGFLGPKEEIGLYQLVSEFRRGLKSKKVPPYPRIAAELRVICRTYSAEEVMRVIKLFFKRHASANAFTMQAFSAFILRYGRKR